MFSRIALTASALTLGLASLAHADWPQRVFVPYMYLGNSDKFKFTDCSDQIGQNHYTLAFVVANKNGDPAWYGQVPMSQNLYGDQIKSIRQRGGDVIVSFGGADGREIAMTDKDPAKVEAKYQAVLNQYKFNWIDLDIEGSNLEKNPDANKRRNQAMASLQKKNPGLRVTYTLPVIPTGVSDVSLQVLADAKAQGVKVYSANIMVMYFGKEFIHKGKSEAELGIESAKATYEQIKKIDPDTLIGLCPCIGTNGRKDELFTVEDAKVLRKFADETPWICSLSYWSINRDSMSGRGDDTKSDLDQQPFEFANVFKTFTTGK